MIHQFGPYDLINNDGYLSIETRSGWRSNPEDKTRSIPLRILVSHDDDGRLHYEIRAIDVDHIIGNGTSSEVFLASASYDRAFRFMSQISNEIDRMIIAGEIPQTVESFRVVGTHDGHVYSESRFFMTEEEARDEFDSIPKTGGNASYDRGSVGMVRRLFGSDEETIDSISITPDSEEYERVHRLISSWISSKGLSPDRYDVDSLQMVVESNTYSSELSDASDIDGVLSSDDLYNAWKRM